MVLSNPTLPGSGSSDSYLRFSVSVPGGADPRVPADNQAVLVH